jgi:hypothetical protein
MCAHTRSHTPTPTNQPARPSSKHQTHTPPRSVFVHPQTRAAHPDAWDAAVEALRYGSVCVNTPAVTGYAATPLVWGAYPGNTPRVGFWPLLRWGLLGAVSSKLLL